MIKQLLSVFKKDTLMQRAYQRSFDMLDLTYDMFIKSREALRHTEHSLVNVDINDQDHEVNKYQRDVRKDVLSYLAIEGMDELVSGLVLVSIVIDIERIGDYTKNIVEIAQNHPKKLFGGKFENTLEEIENAVEDNFRNSIECFKNSDAQLGIQLLEKYKWVSKASDDCLMAFVRGEDESESSSSSVAAALYFRSLKRINSHLRNIVTSVVNPFHRIGYKPKKKEIKKYSSE